MKIFLVSLGNSFFIFKKIADAFLKHKHLLASFTHFFFRLLQAHHASQFFVIFQRTYNMIIAFLNSTETLWIPVFSLNDRVYESPIYPFFAAIQILIYCSTAYIIVRTCKIITKIRLFHENKNILMAFFLCQWFEAILAKILILPYQIGLIQIGNSPGKSYFSWWSSGRNDMVLVESTDDIRVLYIACYVYRHYMFSMFFGIMAIGVERACATFYIQ